MSKEPKYEHSKGTVTIALDDFKHLEGSAAANLIVERMEPRLHALARKFVKDNKLRNETEDLVNKSLTDLFEQLRSDKEKQSIKDSDSLWAVVATILKQEFLDEYNKVNAQIRGGTGKSSEKKTATYLVENGLITQEQATDALQELEISDQQKKNKSLETVLIQKGFVDYEDLQRALINRPKSHKVTDRQGIVQIDESGNERSFDQFSLDVDAEKIAALVVKIVDRIDDPALLRILDLKMLKRPEIDDPELLKFLDEKKANRNQLSNQEIADILFAEGLMKTKSRESVRRKCKMLKDFAVEQSELFLY